MESEGTLPFQDLLIGRNEEDDVKMQIYRKPTYADHYLNVSFYHPMEHKLSAVRKKPVSDLRQL